ncbi:hypothetical protein DL96DRAFT_837937 [Flagelloscypha sp. PMI_526]|nr:hypothetical protein DL96DRAFT_837937 [Flagelloscypha sp. PMI_526]
MEDLTTEERKHALDDYDAKILDLVRKTQVVTSKRNALVPACFLLPELLLTIFVHVVEDWFYASHLVIGEPRDGITDGYFPPRGLDWRPSVLHVCRRWREVATSTSLLWQYVILDELEPLLYESLEKTNSLPKWARTHTYSFQLNDQEVLARIQVRQIQHLSLLRNSFASLEILQLDLYSVHAVKTLLQIEETFPLIKDFNLKLIYGSYFSSEELEEYHEVITRLPLFILQMPNVRLLWLTVPWTIELASLPSHVSSVWLDAGLRKWLTGSLPPASILSPVLWNNLERLRHLTIGRNYIGIASETTQLALPCLQRLHILDGGAEELVAFLDVVSTPHSTFVQLDDVTIGHAGHLPALKRTIKRLTAPSDDQLTSKIEWNLSGPPEFRSNIMNLSRGRELSDPSSLPFSGFSISFRYSNGLEVSEILGALLHEDLRFALLSFDLEGADLEVTNSVLGVTRSISDALNGPSDLAVETFFGLNGPQKQSWEIHRPP